MRRRSSHLHHCRGLVLLICGFSWIAGHAADFRIRDVEGLIDLTLAYGAAYRFRNADKRIVAIANGGKAENANRDDGDLNYKEGIVSNAVRANADLTLSWKQFGAYVRGFAMYDRENQDKDRARTPLSSNGRDIIGKNADLLDHYVSMRATAWGVPMIFRLGDQVVNWGESSFIRDGVDIINPLNLANLGQPVVPGRDLLIPQGMFWGAANLTEHVAVEGYYQYEWKKVELPPVGSFFSTNDLAGSDGINFAMLGAGRYSDLGTDLDAAFALPPGTLGFDPNFYKLPGSGIGNADDHGQFGLTISTILPDANSTRISAHVVRYHSRLPIISGRTASQAAIDQTSQENVDELAARLAPVYEGTGLTPEEAADAATETAGALTTSQYANQASYRVEYPEDITMFGLSFSTATIRRGLLLSGELSHHRDYPFQISLTQIFGGVLSPMEFEGGAGSSDLGEFGANQNVRGYIKLNRSQATLGVTQLIGPRLGAAQTALNGDVAWAHIHDMPGSDDLPLQGSETPTSNSWGYRIGGLMTYNGVLGGLTLSPRVLWTHDVGGVTPAPVGTFLEGRKSFTVGMGLGYINRWTASMSYTSFMGAGSANLTRDRDLLRFRVSYTF